MNQRWLIERGLIVYRRRHRWRRSRLDRDSANGRHGSNWKKKILRTLVLTHGLTLQASSEELKGLPATRNKKITVTHDGQLRWHDRKANDREYSQPDRVDVDACERIEISANGVAETYRRRRAQNLPQRGTAVRRRPGYARADLQEVQAVEKLE